MQPHAQVSSGACPRCGYDGIPPINRLPAELVERFLSYLHITDIAQAASVCRDWYALITGAPALWANLDLTFVDNYGAAFLSGLLARSAEAPLSLSFRRTSMTTVPLSSLCAILEPVLCRIRSFAFHARDASMYIPVLHLLRGSAPLLEYLDLAVRGWTFWERPNNARFRDVEYLVRLGRQLRYIDCGEHRLPPAPMVFPSVVHLRISVRGRNATEGLGDIFSQFPTMRTLCIYDGFAGVPSLPTWHPLQRLELHAPPDGTYEPVPDLSWTHLRGLGLLRVAEIEMHGFTLSVLAGASLDRNWTARTLSIDLVGTFDATFVSGTQKCRMLFLIVRDARHAVDAQNLMQNAAFWAEMTEFTLAGAVTMPKEHWQRITVPFPAVPAPLLVALNLVLSLPQEKVTLALQTWIDRKPTLFDPTFVRQLGVLHAPSLRAINIQARAAQYMWYLAPTLRAIPASILADFIVQHVQSDGARTPELILPGPHMRIVGDAASTTELFSLVSFSGHSSST